MDKSIRWWLILGLLAFTLAFICVACGTSECGTLVMICNGAEHIVMSGVKGLSQDVDDDTRYFRF